MRGIFTFYTPLYFFCPPPPLLFGLPVQPKQVDLKTTASPDETTEKVSAYIRS